jgi:hypothetical protein
MKAHIFIGGQFEGEFDVDSRFVHGQLFQPEGVAFFCPDCHDIWARIVVIGQPSSVETRHCLRHHRHRWWPGGSIWVPWRQDLTDHFPRATLEREFWRHMQLDEQEAA